MTDSTFYANMLGKSGVFKSETKDGWRIKLGVLTAVQSVGDCLIFFDEANSCYNEFSLQECLSTISLTPVKTDTKKLLVENSQNNPISFTKSHRDVSTNTGFEKYIGQWGIAWKDTSKGEKNYGYRLIRLDLISVKDGKPVFKMKTGAKNWVYFKPFDNFRPLSQAEVESKSIGFGWNNSESRRLEKKLVVYHSAALRDVDGEKVRKFYCSNYTGVAPYQLYDNFVSVKEIRDQLEKNGEKMAVVEE